MAEESHFLKEYVLKESQPELQPLQVALRISHQGRPDILRKVV